MAQPGKPDKIRQLRDLQKKVADRAHYGTGKPKNSPGTKKKHAQLAKDIVQEGMSMKDAMLKAGYSEGSAANLKKFLNTCPGVREAMRKELALWTSENPEHDLGVIRGRLMQIVMTGRDVDAIAAAKVAGQDKRLQMFTPQVQVGILAMPSPMGFKEEMEKHLPKVIDVESEEEK